MGSHFSLQWKHVCQCVNFLSKPTWWLVQWLSCSHQHPLFSGNSLLSIKQLKERSRHAWNERRRLQVSSITNKRRSYIYVYLSFSNSIMHDNSGTFQFQKPILNRKPKTYQDDFQIPVRLQKKCRFPLCELKQKSMY